MKEISKEKFEKQQKNLLNLIRGILIPPWQKQRMFRMIKMS